MMVYYLIVGNATLFWQTLCLSCIVISFEVIAGLVQLITALLMDHHGAKLKYMLFAPLYMLWFWVVNPTTVVVTFIPAIKTIFAGSEGTWKSPERQVFEEK